MDPSAPSYIERQADHDLLRALLAREYVFLLDSRQKGKSSMVARTIVRLKDQGIFTVKLDLQRIGANVTPEQWYAGMLAAIGQELDLTAELFDYWKANPAVGPLARWIGALQDVLLAERNAPVVIFVDEVDFVRALPFPTDEFFAGIRDCYNRRAEGKGFERVTFCIVGVATPGQLIRNPEITPFNIGTRIDISDFTPEETNLYVEVLANGSKDGGKLMARVNFWLNGHPYLTQLLCRHIVEDSAIRTAHDVDALVRRLFLTPEARQREPNFSDVERRMLDPDVPGLSPEEKRTQVLELYGRVLKGKRVEVAEENPVVATLRLSGVGLEDRRALRVRNRLYGILFDEKWRRQSLPEAEMRRQQGAARVALLRTATVAGVVLLGVTGVALNMNRLASDKTRAYSRLQVTAKELEYASTEKQKSLVELQKRSQELQVASDKRAEAIKRLNQRTNELQQMTKARELALMATRNLNLGLKRESDEKAKTIQALAASQEQLERQSYNTLISNVSAGLGTMDARRISAAMSRLSRENQKEWEWGHLSLLTRNPVLFGNTGVPAAFEASAQGDISIISRTSKLTIRNLSLVKENPVWAPKDPEAELERAEAKAKGQSSRDGEYLYHSGPGFRIWTNNLDGRDTLCEAPSNRILVPAKKGQFISDFDPVLGEYLVNTSQDINNLEIRSVRKHELRATIRCNRAIYGGRFLPNGNVLVLCWARGVSDCEYLITSRTGEVLFRARIDAPDVQRPFAISPDGQFLALIFSDRMEFGSRLQIRRTKDLGLVREIYEKGEGSHALCFSPNSQELAIGYASGTVKFLDTGSAKVTGYVLGQKSSITGLMYSKDGRYLASIGVDGDVVVWPTSSRPAMETLTFPGLRILDRTIAYDGRTLLVALSDGSLVSRDLHTGREVRRDFGEIGTRSDQINVITVSRSQPLAYVNHNSGVLSAVDVHSLKTVRKAQIYEGTWIYTIVSPGNRRLICISGTGDKPGGATFKQDTAVVDAKSLKVLSRFRTGTRLRTANARGGFLASVDPVGDTEVTVYTEEGGIVRRWRETKKVAGLALSADGRKIAVSLRHADANGREIFDQPGIVRIYDLPSGTLKWEISGDVGPHMGLGFSPNGRFLTALANTGEVVRWDLSRGRFMGELVSGAVAYRATYSVDGERVAAIVSPRMLSGWQPGYFNELRIWDGRTGDELVSLPFEVDQAVVAPRSFSGLTTPLFSQDGRTIVAVGIDGVLRVWHSTDPGTARPAGNLRKPEPGPPKPKVPTLPPR